MLLEFSKMHGLGNDFMVIESLSHSVTLDPDTVQAWSNRHQGIGFDQLLLIGPPKLPDADFNYQVFNSDGTEVAQCGNGARCVAKYIRDKQLSPKSNLVLTTEHGVLELAWAGEQVEVNMGSPNFDPKMIPLDTSHTELTQLENGFYKLQLGEQPVEFQSLSIGNPHLVMKVDSVDAAPVETLGPLLESHPAFPERVNVSFVEVASENELRLRVFERGAGETQACGSGACAAMAASLMQNWVSNQAVVHLKGGVLSISWQGKSSPIFMKGDAAHVFTGKIEVPDQLLKET